MSDQAENLRRRVKAQKALRLGLWSGIGVDGPSLALALTTALQEDAGEEARIEALDRSQCAAASVVATRADPESLATAYAVLGSEGRRGPVGLILVAAPGYQGGARAAAAVRATAWQFRQIRVVDLGTLPTPAAGMAAPETATTALRTAARRVLAVEWEAAP